jgi:heme exporter protein A
MVTRVRTRGLGRAYDAHYALVGLNAELPGGAITALLGPNGAGKSTLIGILSTLQRPTEGDVFFDDRRVTEPPAEIRGQIGYVGHRTMLYGPLTARENLRFFGRLYAVDDLEARVTALLGRVGLARDADRPVRGFSRGMSQRLALARAVLPEPALLLLDEPFTGLDQEGISMAAGLIADQRARGAVVVLASHDLAITETLADRALVLRRGRKVYEGTVAGDLAALYRERVAA